MAFYVLKIILLLSLMCAVLTKNEELDYRNKISEAEHAFRRPQAHHTHIIRFHHHNQHHNHHNHQQFNREHHREVNTEQHYYPLNYHHVRHESNTKHHHQHHDVTYLNHNNLDSSSSLQQRDNLNNPHHKNSDFSLIASKNEGSRRVEHVHHRNHQRSFPHQIQNMHQLKEDEISDQPNHETINMEEEDADEDYFEDYNDDDEEEEAHHETSTVNPHVLTTESPFEPIRQAYMTFLPANERNYRSPQNPYFNNEKSNTDKSYNNLSPRRTLETKSLRTSKSLYRSTTEDNFEKNYDDDEDETDSNLNVADDISITFQNDMNDLHDDSRDTVRKHQLKFTPQKNQNENKQQLHIRPQTSLLDVNIGTGGNGLNHRSLNNKVSGLFLTYAY